MNSFRWTVTSSFFCVPYQRNQLRQKSTQKYYTISVTLSSGKTRDVGVRASSLEVAEQRAMKRVKEAVGINRGGK